MNVLLAHRYNSDIDPSGYHMSEKLDGVRAIWTGSQLVSRYGNVFNAPKWFVENFPATTKLDGELWLGRGKGLFERTSSIARSGEDKGWRDLAFMTFDIPDPTAGAVESRWQRLQEVVANTKSSYLKYVPQTVCLNYTHLMATLEAVIALKGEGIILRKPRSTYVGTRSNTLLKVTKFLSDEAKVVGHTPLVSAGRIMPNMMGALQCVNEKGIEFKVGTGFTDEQRKKPPPIGSQITYKYLGLTKNGKPRHPVYVAIRNYE